jgi:hypothetical protein
MLPETKNEKVPGFKFKYLKEFAVTFAHVYSSTTFIPIPQQKPRTPSKTDTRRFHNELIKAPGQFDYKPPATAALFLL